LPLLRISSGVSAQAPNVNRWLWGGVAAVALFPCPAGAAVEKVRRDVTDFTPRTNLESQAYQPVVDQVAVADDARNTRGQNAGPTMPGVVWFGLIVGALVSIGLIFTLQIRRSPRELLLAGLYSALIAVLLFLIWDLDTPFGHSPSDSTSAFLALFPGVS
jgi:hypothetical protein